METLKPSKATGEDKISSAIIKVPSEPLSASLFAIYPLFAIYLCHY